MSDPESASDCQDKWHTHIEYLWLSVAGDYSSPNHDEGQTATGQVDDRYRSPYPGHPVHPLRSRRYLKAFHDSPLRAANLSVGSLELYRLQASARRSED